MMRTTFMLLLCALPLSGCGAGPAQLQSTRPTAASPKANASASPGLTNAQFSLEPGDLLFQDLDCGPMCDAIETVTQGIDGARLSHVAMITEVGTRPMAIEAYTQGVALVALETILRRSADEHGRPKVLVGRLKPEYRYLIVTAIHSAKKHLGKPYDEAFLMNNGAYYCSELLYDAFLEANDNKQLFELAPMTYRLAGKSDFAPVWRQHFEARSEAIPEGKPGINPGSMSRSPVLQIVHAYGQPQRNASQLVP